MKIHEYNEMMRYLVKRPPEKYSKEEKKEIVKDFYKKAEQPKPKPMEMSKYVSRIQQLYGNSEPLSDDEVKKRLAEERYNDRIQEQDRAKKKVIKKTLIAEKPKPVKPPIIDYLELQDWLNEIDPQWWTDEDSKKEVLLKVPKSKLSGLASILKRG